MEPLYPHTFQELLDSDAVTSQTRAALKARMDRAIVAAPQTLTAREMWTLRAVCARLIPQPERKLPIDLAGFLDERLTQGKGNGWRYDVLPPATEMVSLLLLGLNDFALSRHGDEFAALDAEKQDSILESMQRGEISGGTWQTLPAPRAFESLLAELVEHFASHPHAQQDMGFVGFADTPGWTYIGLNEREAREPEELTAEMEGAKADQSGQSPELPPKSPTQEIKSSIPALRLDAIAAQNDEVDALIIGTGAGGAPLLARLAQAGLKVVALEAGSHYDPQRDFATDEKAQAKLFWSDERLSAGRDPLAFGSNNSGMGVGGSTLHYTAYTPRVQPDDLRLYSEFGVGCDWPLSYENLEPYYDELEAFLGISGPTPYPWGPSRKTAYPLPPLPLNGAAQLMQRGCDTLGIKTSPAANAALSAPYFVPGIGWRAACTNRGFCQAGCSTGAKASMDVTFLPLAASHGAEIRPNCFVTRIEMHQGRVTGVVYVHDGKEERQKCRHLFVCAGAIETPRLLILNELCPDSGQVGRNFMAHTGMQMWGTFDEMVRPYKGIPGALISEDTHRPQQRFKDADFAGGYLLQSIGVMPVTYASQLAHGKQEEGAALWGEPLREHLRGYNHTAGINILGECLPYESNYLELSDELDARGLPKPRIHFSAGENERRLHAHARKLMSSIFEAAGARQMWVFERFAHIIGTARMGHDPARAVVNADCRSFEIPNLFICDNSIFPSALSANPALTIMALSLRTADQFLAKR